MTCSDCGERKGVHPVALRLDGSIDYVCVLCFNRNWRAAMHHLSCDCAHCEFGKQVVKDRL